MEGVVDYEFVSMSVSDRDWIREYLASVGSEQVDNCEYWMVCEDIDGDVTVYPVSTNDIKPVDVEDDGFDFEGMGILQVVSALQTMGFPRHDYE